MAVTTGAVVNGSNCSCCPRSAYEAACTSLEQPSRSLPDPCPTPRSVGTLAQPFTIPTQGWQQQADLVLDPIKGFSTFGASRKGSVVNSIDSNSIIFETDPTGNSSSTVAKVSYVAGQYASNSGVTFNAFPWAANQSMGDEARLQYSVWFDQGFDWVRGGKLPGFYGGDVSGSLGCSGGEMSDNCWSMRLMWREGGRGEVYAYVPPENQTCELSAAPGVELKCDSFAGGWCFGTSIGAAYWTFPRGAWSTIDIYVKMNTVGQQDGVLAVALNGTTSIYYPSLVWRTTDSVNINTVFFSTFFGGGSSAYAPNTTQVAMFKDFKVWANPAGVSATPAAAPSPAPAPEVTVPGSNATASGEVSSSSLRGSGGSRRRA